MRQRNMHSSVRLQIPHTGYRVPRRVEVGVQAEMGASGEREAGEVFDPVQESPR